MEIQLSNGMKIENCTELLFKFYQEDAHELYDKLNVPQDDQLDLVALSSLAFFEVQNPPLSAWRELWSKKELIEKQLRKVPSSISITDEEIPWEELFGLFEIFLQVKGFRCPRVSKILHKKRPSLIPILDEARIVKKYYWSVVDDTILKIKREADAAGHKVPLSAIKQEALNFPGVMLNLIQAVREDVLRNKDVLSDLQKQLHVKDIHLTLLRIYDIILWERDGK